jgi:uncharacterized protein (DUF1800 family)
MKNSKIVFILISIVIGSFFSSFSKEEKIKLPYKQAGLSKEQAAAHLLNRLSFGATPGQIDKVVALGLENWIVQQLAAAQPDEILTEKLASYDALKMSNKEILASFPRGPRILKMAIDDGVINKDSVANSDKKAYREVLANYMKQKNLRPEQELFRQLINQKIIRATYSNNQLQELLTDFWFNHFNVALTKNDCAPFVLAYERDAIRPNVLGNFGTMLLATAKSPAMLTYLDNFSSTGVNEELNNKPAAKRIKKMMEANLVKRMANMDSNSTQAKAINKLQQGKKSQGLNENYAREVMELHTLGVDGGYTQADVTQAAKVLTGWTIYPTGENAMAKIIERIGQDKLASNGFVHEGDFLFAANRHDTKEKTVLGKTFAAGGGYEEGEALLNLLATHKATANFIAKKLATRFVSDNPPASLVQKMATNFLATNGNIKEVLITMLNAPEFWSKDALREKTKSPFEYAISAIRSLDADVNTPFLLSNWVTKMGQKLYYYQAPTGFPDKGAYWINTGSLLNRMNFGLALATKKIPGITFDLAALNQNHEPESAEAALNTYAQLILPQRNVAATIKRLTPIINDPTFGQKLEAAANKNTPAVAMDNEVTMAATTTINPGAMEDSNTNQKRLKKLKANKGNTNFEMPGNNSMLNQVVGIIIGSPEFQRK